MPACSYNVVLLSHQGTWRGRWILLNWTFSIEFSQSTPVFPESNGILQGVLQSRSTNRLLDMITHVYIQESYLGAGSCPMFCRLCPIIFAGGILVLSHVSWVNSLFHPLFLFFNYLLLLLLLLLLFFVITIAILIFVIVITNTTTITITIIYYYY
jgi:hypothetical protein